MAAAVAEHLGGRPEIAWGVYSKTDVDLNSWMREYIEGSMDIAMAVLAELGGALSHAGYPYAQTICVTQASLS